MIRRLALALLAPVVVCLTLVACGGGGGGNDTPPAPAPTALGYPSPQVLLLGSAMSPITPTVTGDVGSYAVAPALPAGLSLDTATGRIAGTPTVTALPATYRVTAGNATGSTVFDLSLSVVAVARVSGDIARMAVAGSPIEVEVVVQTTAIDAGSLFARASDSRGLFAPEVSVVAQDDDTASLRLSTVARTSPSRVTGTLEIELCRNAACDEASRLAPLTVPYVVRVMAADTPWPGDDLRTLSRWPGAADWSAVQGNAAHTGHVPVRVDPDQFTPRWKVAGNSLYGSWSVLKPNLVTADGLLFVASSEYMTGGVVQARRESDGGEAWRFDLAGLTYPVANPVTVADGVVHFIGGHQDATYMFARRAADGSPVYRSRLASQWETFLAPTLGPDGTLFANAGTYGGLYALDPQGNVLYFSNQSQTSNCTPAIGPAGVHAYTGDKLQVLDPATGEVRVTIPDPGFQNFVYEIGGAPVLGDPALGSVFAAAYANAAVAGTGGNALVNFRTGSGSIAWRIPGQYPVTPAYRAGVVYAVNDNPMRLEARAEANGALLWSWTPYAAGETSFVGEVLVTDNLVFVSTNTSTHAIDLASQRTVWSYPASGKLALSANGVLYIHNSTALVAVNLK